MTFLPELLKFDFTQSLPKDKSVAYLEPSQIRLFSRAPRLYNKMCPSVDRLVGRSSGRSVGRSVRLSSMSRDKTASGYCRVYELVSIEVIKQDDRKDIDILMDDGFFLRFQIYKRLSHPKRYYWVAAHKTRFQPLPKSSSPAYKSGKMVYGVFDTTNCKDTAVAEAGENLV